MELTNYLNEKISDVNTPILFVGSGITKRYCKVNGKKFPTWKELLENIIEKYSSNRYHYNLKETEALEKLSQEGKVISNSLKYQKIAEIIEKEFNNSVWSGKLLDKDIEEQILEIFDKNRNLSPMKIYISLLFNNIEVSKDPVLIEELNELKKLSTKPLIIITTNYDRFLETIFCNYKVIKGQKLLTDEHFATIFKIHGCITEPTSIVLTEKDYLDMKNAKRVLNARLITFFAEHPVFFLGYSLDDNNIQEFMDSIYVSFSKEEKELRKISEKFIVVNWEKDKSTLEVEDCNLVKEKIIMPLKQIKTDNYLEIYKALNNFDIKIDVTKFKFLQNLYLVALKGDKKENLDFVFANEYTGEKLPSKTLIGAGYAISFLAYDLNTHFNKIINHSRNDIPISSDDFIKLFLPILNKGGGRAPIPMFYYLKDFKENLAELPEKNKRIISENCNKIVKLYESYSKMSEDNIYESLNDILIDVKKVGTRQRLIFQKYINGEISDEEILNFVREKVKKKGLETFTRRLILLYDFKINNNPSIKEKIKNELNINLPD